MSSSQPIRGDEGAVSRGGSSSTGRRLGARGGNSGVLKREVGHELNITEDGWHGNNSIDKRK